MWWGPASGGPLNPATVGAAHHADPAVGPRLSGGPLDAVVAVVVLVEEGKPLAVGVVPAADVHQDADESAFRQISRLTDVEILIAVGAAVQDRWEWTSGRARIGKVDIARQADPISHGNADIE